MNLNDNNNLRGATHRRELQYISRIGGNLGDLPSLNVFIFLVWVLIFLSGVIALFIVWRRQVEWMKKQKEVIKCNLFKEIDSWITIKMAITNILVMEIHNTKMINMKLKIKANTMMVINNLMLNQHQTKTNWHKTVIKINRFMEINKITSNKIK